MRLASSPFLFALLLTAIGCGSAPDQTASTPQPTTVPEETKRDEVLVRFGSSHGMCMGYCEAEYTLRADGLHAIRRGRGRTDTTAYPMQQQTLKLEEGTVQAAMANWDEAAFAAAPDVIGCPDCADGGRCWVEVVYKGKPRLITFDCSSGSEQLKGFTDALWQLTEKVQWPDAAPAEGDR